MCCCASKHHPRQIARRMHGQSCCCRPDSGEQLDQLREYRQGLEEELAAVHDQIAELERQQ